MSSITRSGSKNNMSQEETKKQKIGRSMSKTDRAFGMSKGLGLGA